MKYNKNSTYASVSMAREDPTAKHGISMIFVINLKCDGDSRI